MVRELQDVDVTAPADACFECEVSLPVVKAPTWTLKGETLHPGPKVVVEKMGTVHRLTIKQTSTDMCGIVCFIIGRAKSTAHLRVISKSYACSCMFKYCRVEVYIVVYILYTTILLLLTGNISDAYS